MRKSLGGFYTGASSSASRASSSFFDDDSLQFLSDQKYYYSAIYEFSQGEAPKLIWEYGSVNGMSEMGSFMQFLINTPAPKSNDNNNNIDFTFGVTSIVSTFEGAHFLAIYFQVLDSQARGFTRHLVFVIANQSRDLLNFCYSKYLKTFTKLLYGLYEYSERNFKVEIKEYAESLQKTITMSQNQTLSDKLLELTKILLIFNIDITNLDSEKGQIKTSDYFNIVNNELRPVEVVIDLSYVFLSEIIMLIESLPKTETKFAIISQIDIFEENPTIDFGGYNNKYSELVLNIMNSNYDEEIPSETQNNSILYDDSNSINSNGMNSKNKHGYYQYFNYSLKELVSRHVFNYCLFSILSGRTLVIRSNQTSKALSLVKKISILSPFFKPEFILQKDTVDPSECLKYAFVITKNILDSDKKNLSILDLISMVYSGDGCPQKSFVACELCREQVVNHIESEKVFLLHLYSTLNRISIRFLIKLSEYSKIGKILTKDKMLTSLKEFGFSPDDEPIFRYCIHCYFNKQHTRPILMNNISRGGLTLITI
ncbi:hypothetical protein TRFO_15332 [Tritrichomonas foetus]|uniref:Folliculin/SMCR8 longin domain-containing protein n=1 Tax=Tritrichomonas foetus TaxID=1144522 RepID=A0A1J4KX77_9EUKA|nr:hypothetical protein TRFO_15332 [Tritrichomonas foetus]|eukprot:OHT14308.1 hypothetical protein TRFO_15332 [Tritrichomonas foetus]